MSYAGKDKSVDKGAPVEFFKFYGNFGTFRYTSDDAPAMCNGELYLPIKGGVSCGAVETSSVADSVITVDITVPSNSGVALLYCFNKTPDNMTVEVRRAHRGDDWSVEFEVEWHGFALDTTVTGDYATIKTGSVIQAKLQGNVAAIYYQRSCNHVLFDERCKVNKADWTLEAVVTKIQGKLITVEEVPAGNGALKAGEIIIPRSSEKRGIYGNDENIITISYPFIDIEIGDAVELVYGCDHRRLGHCFSRFNNVANYGGFDFIPVTNPFVDLRFDTIVTETIKEEWRANSPHQYAPYK